MHHELAKVSPLRVYRSLSVVAGLALAACATSGCNSENVDGSAGDRRVGVGQEGAVSAEVCLNIVRQGPLGSVFDTQLLARDPPKTYGASQVFSTGVLPADGLERRPLLRFDLSAIPSGADVTDARLFLALGPAGVGGQGTIGVHRVTAPWNEATVTWQSFNSAFDPTVVESFSNNANPFSVDIRSLVAGWVAGTSPNDGLMLADQGGPVTNFWSSESANADLRPRLTVCYDVTCSPGWADCNNDGHDGCEVDLTASAANCGACSHACAPSSVCTNGTCQAASPTCGDGVAAGAEGCDDGNVVAGDGCSATCGVEAGYACMGSPSVCTCAEGTPCDAGDRCTTGDECQSGACVGVPVICIAGDCQGTGTCDGQTGQCVFAPAVDGEACTGGACLDGQCAPTELEVAVYDRRGDPIQGAKVSVGGVTKTTPSSGKVTYSGIASGNAVAKITSTGYAPASPSTDVAAGAQNSIVAHLLNESEPVPFQPASGLDTIVDDKVRVLVPATTDAGAPALVRADGSALPANAIVEVTVAPLDPSVDLDMMPGALVGVPEGGTQQVSLVSVFMADVTLRQGTNAVQLAPGAKATIEFTLPDDLQGDYQVGDTIPAWYFDLAQGIWIQEGEGTVQDSLAEPGKLVWTAQVSHFSWWNVDFYKPQRDCVRVTVVQSDSPAFIGGATVTVASLSNNYYRYSKTTDVVSGQACINMPIDDLAQVTASHTVFMNMVGGPQQIITGTDPNGPTCSGAGTGACKSLVVYLGGNTCLNGVVDDGVGGVIDGAKVIARYNTGRGPESTSTTTDINGEYCVEAPVGTQVLVQASTTNNLQTDEQIVTSGPSQLACGDIGCTPVPTLTPMCNATCSKWAFGYGDASLQTAKDVAVDSSGNVFIAGYFQGSMLGLTSSGLDDIYVAKFDPNGDFLWAKRFGDAAGTGAQHAYAVAVDQGGNPIIVGSFTSSIDFPRPAGLGNYTLTAVEGYDGFLTKLSGVDGTAIEARSVGGHGNQHVMDVLLDNSDSVHPDSVVILAQFNDEIDPTGGQYVSSPSTSCSITAPWSQYGPCVSAGGDDIFIMKIFSNSFYVWARTYGGVGDEHVTHGGLDPSGALVLTGDFNSAFSFGGTTGTLAPTSSGTDAYVAKLQLPILFGSDTPRWSRRFGVTGGATTCSISPGNRSGRGTAFDGLGNVWITGDFNGCVVLDTVLEVSAGAPATDAYWARLDGIGGATLNYDIIRNSSQQHGSDITVDTDGSLILTGSVRGPITFDVPRPAIGLEDLFVAKLSPSGNYVWSRRFGGTITSAVANPAVAVRPYASGAVAGDIAVTGTFTGKVVFDATNGVEVTSNGGSDVFISKMLSVQ